MNERRMMMKCKLIKEPARAREDFSRWLFKGIDNGDIKELFFKFFSTLFFKK